MRESGLERAAFFFPHGYLVRVSGQENRVSIIGATAAVRVRISDRAFVEDLQTYLQAAECSVRVVGEFTLDVSMPRAPSDDQALREIAIYLRTWQAMNPEVHARIVGEGEPH
jgi:hypothetical protein